MGASYRKIARRPFWHAVFRARIAVAQLSSWKSRRFQLPDGAHVSFISGETMVAAPKGYYLLPDSMGEASLHGNVIEHPIEDCGRKVLGCRL